MERKELIKALDVVSAEIRLTVGVSEPDVFRHCMYGDAARLVCRDLPRLSAALKRDGAVNAEQVLRDVGASVEANRNLFAWVAPTLSPEAQSIMSPGGGPLLGSAMDCLAKEAGLIRDDMLSLRPGAPAQVMFADARRAIAMGRGREF